MVSLMCQYSCERTDGVATDWQFKHLTSRAVGGITTPEQADALDRMEAVEIPRQYRRAF